MPDDLTFTPTMPAFDDEDALTEDDLRRLADYFTMTGPFRSGPDFERTTLLPEAVKRFRADTMRKAEWCARKLRPLYQSRDEIRANTKQWIEDLRAFEAGELKRTDGPVAFFEHHLTEYALTQRKATGKATTRLPSATIKTTNVPAAVKVADEALVMAWAKTVFDPALFDDDPDKAQAAAEILGAIVKVTEKVLVSELRSHVELAEIGTGRSVLMLSCACVEVLEEDVGDEQTAVCALHGPVAVVKRKAETVLVPSYGHHPVPGCEVEPGHVSVRVVASGS